MSTEQHNSKFTIQWEKGTKINKNIHIWIACN